MSSLLKPAWGLLQAQRPDAAHEQSLLFRDQVAHWPMSEGGGAQLYDLSGQGNHGTLNGTLSTRWAEKGQWGSALDWNGTTDRVDVPTHSSLDFGTTDFSVSAWVKTDLVDSTYRFIIDKGNSGLDCQTLQFLLYPTGNRFYFYYDTAACAASAGVFSTTVPVVGQWYHVVGTASRTGVSTLYVNGVPEGTVAGTAGSITNAAPLTIGAQKSGGAYQNFWNGQLDDLRIWKRALSAGDVMRLYTEPWAPWFRPFGARGIQALSWLDFAHGSPQIEWYRHRPFAAIGD